LFKASEAISYDWTNVVRCAYYYFKSECNSFKKNPCFFLQITCRHLLFTSKISLSINNVMWA